MIRSVAIIIVISAYSLFAALGSGLYLRIGAGVSGLAGDDLYMVPAEDHYRDISRDSLYVSYNNFATNSPLIRPTITAGWEQSLNRVLSVSSGLGLAFSGAAWKATPVKNGTGKITSVPKIDASLKLTYLTLPVNVHLMLPLNSGGFVLSFGPRLALLCSARFENHVRLTGLDERSLFRPLTLGLDGAFGGEIQLRKLDLLMSLRFTAGVANEYRNQSFNLRNQSISLETGLRWTTRRHI